MAVTIKHIRNSALIAVTALSLGGCLSAKRPLFDDAIAVAPLADGQYRAYERTSGLRFKQSDTITVTRVGQGYDVVDAQQRSHRVTLYPFGAKAYIAQAKTDGDGYVYVQIEPRSDAILIRAADCSKQDKAKLSALGVNVTSQECKLDDVKDTAALLAALKFGRSMGKLIKK